MSYEIEIKQDCKKCIKKSCKKNHELEKAIRNKIEEIVQNPYHYKPLKYDLAGEWRVHIMKNYVLKYEIDEQRKTVTFIYFSHHDEAYAR